MNDNDISKRLSAQLEASLLAAIAGPPRPQRQTAIRLRGRTFETVELDDAGNVIEPVRCTCGTMIVMHRPNCPFAYLTI